MEPTVECEQRGDVLRVVLSGEIDCATDGRLRAALDLVRDSSARAVEVDLSRVTFVDSTTAAFLLDADRLTRRTGSRLSVHGACPWVAEVLRLTGVGQLLGMPGATGLVPAPRCDMSNPASRYPVTP